MDHPQDLKGFRQGSLGVKAKNEALNALSIARYGAQISPDLLWSHQKQTS